MKNFARIIALALVVVLSLALFTSCSTSKYTILDENFGSDKIGIAARNADVQLGLMVQLKLSDMIKDKKTTEISEKWFGEDIYLTKAAYAEANNTASATDKSWDDIKTKGKLVLGVDPNFKPFAYKENGQIVGFDIDLANEVAKRLEVTLEIKEVATENFATELKDKNIDIAWSRLSITQDLTKTMYITKPYFDNKQIIIVKGNSKIAAMADLEGKTVGVVGSSDSKAAIEANESGIADKITIKDSYTDAASAFADLNEGNIDAIVMRQADAYYFMASEKK